MREASAGAAVTPASEAHIFTRLLPRRVAGLRARVFFALVPAMLIVIAAGLMLQREIAATLSTTQAESFAGVALARVAEADAHLQRAALAVERYRSTGLAQFEAQYLDQKLRANIGLLTSPPSGNGAFAAEMIERLQNVQVMADRFVSEMDQRMAEPRGPAAPIVTVFPARVAYEQTVEAYRHFELQRQSSRQDHLADQVGDVSTQVLLVVVLAAAVQMWMFLIIERNQLARRAAEAVVEQTERQLTMAADLIPAMIAYASVDGLLLYHNATFARWLGRRGEQLIGLALPTLFGPTNRALLAEKVAAALAGQRSVFDLHVPDSASRRTDLAVHFIPHFAADGGAVVGYFAFFSDVTEFRQLERLKSEFVTTVSHELRTPLTAMQGALGLVAAGLTGSLSEKTRSMLEIAAENCQRLGRIVGDIIDTERMEANRMEFVLADVDAGEVVARAVRQCEPLEVTYGVRLVLLAEAGIAAPVRADGDRLLQVVTNLLSNACKFSPKGAVIDIKVDHVATLVRISVCDRGPGVAPAFRERLFGRFARDAASDTRGAGGSGLGLNIAKRFMEQMGGSIGYFDRPGGGAVFYVDLPLRADVAVAHALAETS